MLSEARAASGVEAPTALRLRPFDRLRASAQRDKQMSAQRDKNSKRELRLRASAQRDKQMSAQRDKNSKREQIADGLRRLRSATQGALAAPLSRI